MSAQAKLVQMQSGEQNSAMYERHFRPDEIAEFLGRDVKTVWRMFEREPGVLVFENKVRSSSRRHRTLMIPKSVYERVYRAMQNEGIDKRMPRGV